MHCCLTTRGWHFGPCLMCEREGGCKMIVVCLYVALRWTSNYPGFNPPLPKTAGYRFWQLQRPWVQKKRWIENILVENHLLNPIRGPEQDCNRWMEYVGDKAAGLHNTTHKSIVTCMCLIVLYVCCRCRSFGKCPCVSWVILTSLQSLRCHHSCRTLPDNLRGTTCHLRRQTPETEGGSCGPGARGCARCRSVRPDTLQGTQETEWSFLYLSEPHRILWLKNKKKKWKKNSINVGNK